VSAFSPARRELVTARAGNKCEYCHLPTRGQVATFPIDHVLPRADGGSNDPDNLALTCPHCNAHKWTASIGPDTDTGKAARFFNPRRENWDDHFAWSGDQLGELLGLTPTGRATIAGLKINDADMIQLRALLAELGLFPEVSG
jgi:hypothetical protein